MKRSAFTIGILSSGIALPSAAAFAAQGEVLSTDISLDTGTGILRGTLTMPPGAGARVPVVLIIAGSGPTDRDGNSRMLGGKSDTYKLLAAALAAQGVATVRYDKRLPATADGEAKLRFDDYANDAAGWVRLLAADRRFSRVTIAGHSEGSLVGILAAQRAPVAAFVSLEGAGRPIGTVLREQLSRGTLDGKPDPQVTRILASLQAGQTVSDVPAAYAALFRASVQPYLISWMRYDPAVELAKLRIPATIVWGTADVQVMRADYDALVRVPNTRGVVVDGMNHVLKHYPDTSPLSILNGYTDPTLPVEPAAVHAVSAAATGT